MKTVSMNEWDQNIHVHSVNGILKEVFLPLNWRHYCMLPEVSSHTQFKYSWLLSGYCWTHVEIIQLICIANQLIDFYVSVTLAWYVLNNSIFLCVLRCIRLMIYNFVLKFSWNLHYKYFLAYPQPNITKIL